MFFFCSHNELLDNLVKKTVQKNKKPKTHFMSASHQNLLNPKKVI